MKSIVFTLVGTALVAGCASVSAAEDKKPEASIPFVNQSGIHQWQADGTHGIWLQDQHRAWFYASLQGVCTGLEFAPRLGFEPTRTTSALDRFGAVVVPGYGRCAIISLTKSDPPPSDKSRKTNTEEPAT